MANKPVEQKVTASSATAYLGSTNLLGLLAAVQDNARLLEMDAGRPEPVRPRDRPDARHLRGRLEGEAHPHAPRTARTAPDRRLGVGATGIPALDTAPVWGGAITLLAGVTAVVWRGLRGTLRLARRAEEFTDDWAGEEERPRASGPPEPWHA
ncbi:hypothetical protein [Streptomyces halobius]|uniref:Uncharacterized protein n=1 Tax=Streptomyces halobius TaxID=2879846 RepID=A0ABY4MEI9_9ACTN|nr:hypothetical protein [Streptomyces halobius]UQA94825.1 hypothetical protein K9S39_25850 [Streptomyces halobius]